LVQVQRNRSLELLRIRKLERSNGLHEGGSGSHEDGQIVGHSKDQHRNRSLVLVLRNRS